MSGAIILNYHHIMKPSIKGQMERFYVDPQSFKKQMRYLYRNRFSVICFDDLVDFLISGKKVSNNTVVLTFDDGYRSVLLEACEVLEKFGFMATVFISTATIGAQNYWDRGVKDDVDILTWDEILELRKKNFSFHSHAVNHVRLTALKENSVINEVKASKVQLERMLAIKRHIFCYPFSDYNENIRRHVIDAGYVAACTSEPGINNASTDMFLLKRIEVDFRDSLLSFAFKINFYRYFGKG